MIERQILSKKVKEFQVTEYIANVLDKPGYSHTEIQRTPAGEKVIIYTSKPGLIVGRKGSNIKELTEVLKSKFGMENPQIEVSEIENPNLNPHSVAKHIVHTFERFGPKRFKFLGYKMLQEVMNSGAIGAEIVISGRGVPSQRSKTWRFTAGYLKKSGDISENYVSKGFAVAHLKSGAVGVKVFILTPDIKLPDKITFYKLTQEEKEVEVIEEKEVESVEVKEEKKETKKKTTKKKETKEVKKTKEKKKEIKKETKKTIKKKDGNTKKNRTKAAK